MSYVVVIPSIHQPYTDACLLSCGMENIFVVDNTEYNHGVPASWNMGIKEMQAIDADWLVICSAAIRFGAEEGLDLARWMEVYANREDAPFLESDSGLGWHLICVSRWLCEEIGTFDENFYPAYFEDNDFAYRSFLHRGTWGWPRLPFDAALVSTAHGVQLGGAPKNARRQQMYYEKKWGGSPSHEHYQTPFNKRGRALSWWLPYHD